LRNGARASCSKVSAPHGADGERRRLHSAEPRSLERSAADICANETAPGSATTLAFSQPRTSARRPARPRRTLDHLARRSRYDQAHARSVENNGQIGDPRLAPILFGGLPKALAAISECV
jgi:hypothetical protein